MKLIWYNRDKFSDQDIAQSKAVANRLKVKKPNEPDLWPFFSGSKMQVPIQYGSRTATGINRMTESKRNK